MINSKLKIEMIIFACQQMRWLSDKGRKTNCPPIAILNLFKSQLVIMVLFTPWAVDVGCVTSDVPFPGGVNNLVRMTRAYDTQISSFWPLRIPAFPFCALGGFKEQFHISCVVMKTLHISFPNVRRGVVWGYSGLKWWGYGVVYLFLSYLITWLVER